MNKKERQKYHFALVIALILYILAIWGGTSIFEFESDAGPADPETAKWVPDPGPHPGRPNYGAFGFPGVVLLS